MKKTFVNADNTKHRPGDAYGKAIAKIINDGVCPFCPENLATYHSRPILVETPYWQLTDNAYPYKGATHHFLMIHTQHIESFEEVTPDAWQDLQTLIKRILATYKIKGGAFVFRFGDTRFTGASVTHLHAQLIVGSGVKNADPVLMRVG